MKRFLLCAGALLVFGGCAGRSAVKPVPLAELAMHGKLEQYLSAKPAEKIIFSADSGFAGEMPAPMDLMMELIHTQPDSKNKFSVIASGKCGIVSKWNRYAAEKIFAGKKFDRQEERKLFLQKNFGKAAPAMLEYFRMLERRTISSAALSGIGYPSYPTALMIYEFDFPDELARALDDAAAKADTVSARNAVAAERKLFDRNRQEMLEKIAEKWQKVVANSGKSSCFTTRFGDEADVKTTLRLDADEKNMILTLTAEEPAPDRRRSQKRPRDFADMWAEDGFEIFIIPDTAKLMQGIQLIVNSRGSLWDARCEGNGLRDTKWNAANATVKFTGLDNAWQVVVTLPWRDLGFDGMPEKPLLVNVYRNRMVKGIPVKTYAWSPVAVGGNYQPDRFGYFIWKEEK